MKEFKYFLLTDYEEEEIYLRERHKQGYKLVHVALPGRYTFVECTPEDYVYRLDFNPQNAKEKASYIQMFEDYGWEYIQDMNEYSYFRKKASETKEEENAIFTDNESKLEMLKRIMQRRFVPILVVFFSCFMTQFINLMHEATPYKYGFVIFFGILFVLYMYLFMHVLAGYKRLKEKYKD